MKIKRIAKDIKSSSVGIFIPVGSAFENEKQMGLAHFIEHMLFKGTKNRTYKQIASDIDRLGGVINAFTSSEYTGFYIKVLRDFLKDGFDVLKDIIANSLIDEKELEKEKSVIIEEINMVNDNPDDAVYEIFLQNAIEGPYGRPTLGTKEHIMSYTRDDLLKFLGEFYKPDDMIISAVGGYVDKFEFDMPDKFFFDDYSKEKINTELHFNFIKGIDIVNRDISQTNLVMGCKLFDIYDDRKYAAFLLNSGFGGNMSSRLFQSIREEKSLCYNIYSSVKFFKKGGIFIVSAATSNHKTQMLIDAIKDEIGKLKEKGFSEKELTDSKTNFLGSYALSLESSHAVMIKQATDTIFYGNYIDENEIMEKVKNVTMEDINNVISTIDLDNFHITCLGNVNSIEW